MTAPRQVCVVGATGVVGREVLTALRDAGVPSEQVTALASERSEGTEVEFGDDTLEVEKASAESFRGAGLALFATPAEVSRTLAPAAQAAGAWAVDASAAFRIDSKVPLLLAGFNDSAPMPAAGRVVGTPSAAVSALVLALEPLRHAFGLADVHVTGMLGASSMGKAGIDELARQTADLLSGRELEARAFPQRLAFNLVPHVGDFDGPWSAEERNWSAECARLWKNGEAPPVRATALFAPVFYGAYLSVAVRLDKRATLEEVRSVWKAARALKLLDVPAERVYPMPMLVTADPTVHVGRARVENDWLYFIAAVDNAGRAAHNLVQIGQALLAKV
ncbi:MAG: aspartate-semialdehyde dehydrogenase [Myxococcota bacterium]